MISARPVLIVKCVQSSGVSGSWGWSPYRHGWSWFMPRLCQHLSDKGESKICERISSHHMKIERRILNVDNGQFKQVEK
jgi:hypothetical protein